MEAPTKYSKPTDDNKLTKAVQAAAEIDVPTTGQRQPGAGDAGVNADGPSVGAPVGESPCTIDGVPALTTVKAGTEAGVDETGTSCGVPSGVVPGTRTGCPEP